MAEAAISKIAAKALGILTVMDPTGEDDKGNETSAKNDITSYAHNRNMSEFLIIHHGTGGE